MIWLRDRLFRLRYPYAEALDAQRARGILTICDALGIGALLGLIYLFSSYVPSVSTDLTIAALVIMLSVSIAVIVLLQTGRVQMGSPILVAAMIVGVAAFIVPYGFNNIGVLSITIPLTLSAALFSRRGVTVTLITQLAVMIGGVMLINSGTLIPDPLFNPKDEARATLVIGGLILVVDTGILWVFSGSQASLLQRTTRALRDLQATTGLSQVMNRQATVDDLLTQTLEVIREQFGYHYAQIFLVEENSRLIVRRARTGAQPARAGEDRRIAPDDAQNVIAAVIRTRQRTRVTATSPRLQRTEFFPMTQSELLIPLKHSGRVLGVLDVQSVQPDAFQDYDVDVLEAIAAQLAVALQNIQHFTELQSVSAERQRLQEQVLRLARDVERLGQEASGRTWTRYLAGRSENVVGFDWKHGQMTSNATVSTTQLAGFQNAMPEAHTENDEQVLVVPIQSRGQILGVMEFRAASDMPWNNRSIELARILAQRLALSLDNIRLFEQTQNNASREQLINQVTTRLQNRTDLDALLATAAEAFNEALGASRTNIKLGLPEQEE